MLKIEKTIIGNGYNTVDSVRDFKIKETATGSLLHQADDSDANRVEARVYVIDQYLKCVRNK